MTPKIETCRLDHLQWTIVPLSGYSQLQRPIHGNFSGDCRCPFFKDDKVRNDLEGRFNNLGGSAVELHPEVVISALFENSCELQDPSPDAPSDFLRGQGVMLQLLARRRTHGMGKHHCRVVNPLKTGDRSSICVWEILLILNSPQ